MTPAMVKLIEILNMLPLLAISYHVVFLFDMSFINQLKYTRCHFIPILTWVTYAYTGLYVISEYEM